MRDDETTGAQEPFEDAALYDWEYRRRRDDVRFYRMLADERGGPILDLACGTGRLLVPLARDGHRLVPRRRASAHARHDLPLPTCRRARARPRTRAPRAPLPPAAHARRRRPPVGPRRLLAAPTLGGLPRHPPIRARIDERHRTTH